MARMRRDDTIAADRHFHLVMLLKLEVICVKYTHKNLITIMSKSLT